VGHAADADHPRAGGGYEEIRQPPGEGKMTEVVAAELELEAVLGVAKWRNHDPAVVDQQIQALVAGTKGIGEMLHRGQARGPVVTVPQGCRHRVPIGYPGGETARPG